MIGMDYNNDDGQYRIMLNTLGTFYFDDKGDIAFTSDESVKALSTIQKNQGCWHFEKYVWLGSVGERTCKWGSRDGANWGLVLRFVDSTSA